MRWWKEERKRGEHVCAGGAGVDWACGRLLGGRRGMRECGFGWRTRGFVRADHPSHSRVDVNTEIAPASPAVPTAYAEVVDRGIEKCDANR